MASFLQQLDQVLCRLARDNFRLCLDVPEVKVRYASLPAELRDYLESVAKPGESDARVLTDDELEQLEDLAAMVPALNSRRWEHWDAADKLATSCTGEIKQELSPADARRWGESAEQHLQQLRQPALDVHQGIATVRHLLWDLRRFARTIEQSDLGGKSATSSADYPSAEFLSEKREELRKMLREFGESKETKQLFKMIKVRASTGYRLLKEIRAEEDGRNDG